MKDQYCLTAKALHWGMAALILCLLVVGTVMIQLPKGDARMAVYGLHKEFGVVVLALALVRLVARQVMGVPALPATMTAREGQLTHLVHWALYGLMFAVPVAGILMSQSGGHDVQVFGLPLPTLLGKDKALHELFEDTHLALAVLLALLVAAHAAAALRHHFVMKDTVLTRMLPW